MPVTSHILYIVDSIYGALIQVICPHIVSVVISCEFSQRQQQYFYSAYPITSIGSIRGPGNLFSFMFTVS